MSITIQPLEPRFIEQLAAWHQAEWYHLDQSATEAVRRQRLAEHCDAGALPVTFVALDDGELVGSVCLVAHDTTDRPQYSPWLSRIYVAPEHRGKGIGKLLINRAKTEMRRQGHGALYLITEDKGPYYARLGWEKMENYELNNHPVEIMGISLF
ncbi:MAG: GNAT family N-acetyltransferase [Marinobacter sp.]|nr:GNAT family N-acetyltransferase [Marinobacter sp.]